MPPSVTKKVSIEAARRARTTGSVADMFVQDGKQRVKKKVQKHRRKPKKPREHAQVVRIRESSDPVQAFFQEDVIVRRARTPLQRVLNMHIFHNLEDMVDGLTPADAFARALRYMFKLNFDRGTDHFNADVGNMWRALSIPGIDSRWLYHLLDDFQPIHKTELDRLLTGSLPLIREYRAEFSAMWAYGEVARSGGLVLASVFPREYASAVRLAMMMEHLTGLSFVDGMFPKARRLRTLHAYARNLELDDVANDVLREAHRCQRTHFDRVENGWVRYFLGRGNYLHASSLVAKKGRRLLHLFHETSERNYGFNAWTEFWRAADIARFGAEQVEYISDRMRLFRMSRSLLREVIRLMGHTEQPKRRGAKARKVRREDRIYGVLADVNGSIDVLRADAHREHAGDSGLINQMPRVQEFEAPASPPPTFVAFPQAQRFFTATTR